MKLLLLASLLFTPAAALTGLSNVAEAQETQQAVAGIRRIVEIR